MLQTPKRVLPGPPTPDLQPLLRSIRLIVFDFDGVFTDNAVWVSEDGTESVRCWRSDGLGLQQLVRLGVEPVILSTEANPVVTVRSRKLKVRCVQDCADKRASLLELLEATGHALETTAYVGNDINDIGCLQAVGLPILVQDAHEDVLDLGRLRTLRPGGYGAVREVCDWIRAAHERTT
jgi:YrbI family 3-deoxy-D-manno-octulosonate 8-phosphate phosphatase